MRPQYARQAYQTSVFRIILKGIFFIFCLSLLFQQVWSAGAPRSQFDSIIRQIARKYDVDPELVHSIIRAESNYDSQAVSPKGAVGLMQLMPETAKQLGVSDPYDPLENIEGGVKHLKDLMDTYNQKEELVLAAYNAGTEAVKKHKGIPPFPETIQYIKRVKSYWTPDKSTGTKTKIYSFVDKSGRRVISNDRNYYLMNKK
jgi:soluble lytic murein transglycosylase-like protein